MTAIDAMAWLRPMADVTLIVLVGLVLRRLGRDPTAPWQAREAALRTVFDDLRALVAQAEGLARDLDDKLADRATELRALLDESAAEARRRRAARRVEQEPAAAGETTDLAARVARLARAALPVEEIARRLDVSAAEVRLLIGIDGGLEPTRARVPAAYADVIAPARRAAAAGRQK